MWSSCLQKCCSSLTVAKHFLPVVSDLPGKLRIGKIAMIFMKQISMKLSPNVREVVEALWELDIGVMFGWSILGTNIIREKQKVELY